MKEWLAVIAANVIIVIHAMALVSVAFGTAQAFLRSFRAMLRPSARGNHFDSAYVQYARWLVAGLTFQLAADIIETAFAPSWDEIGRLAAISVIRTFVQLLPRARHGCGREARGHGSKGGCHTTVVRGHRRRPALAYLRSMMPRLASCPMMRSANAGLSLATDLGLNVLVVAAQTSCFVFTSNSLVSTVAMSY